MRNHSREYGQGRQDLYVWFEYEMPEKPREVFPAFFREYISCALGKGDCLKGPKVFFRRFAGTSQADREIPEASKENSSQ